MLLGQNAVVILSKRNTGLAAGLLQVIIRKSKCGKMWEMHEMPQCFKGRKSRFFRFPVLNEDYLELNSAMRMVKADGEWEITTIVSGGDITLTMHGVKQLAKEYNITWAKHFNKNGYVKLWNVGIINTNNPGQYHRFTNSLLAYGISAANDANSGRVQSMYLVWDKE